MLDIARMTRGKLQIEHRPVDLESVIHAAVEACRPLIDEHGHELQLEVPAGYSIVSGDGHRLTQLLTNLLNNAARYTPQHGHLRLSLTRDHGQAVITVRDDGRGIDTTQLDQIFEMFVRGREPLQRVGEGLGIGLALARTIADLHSGSLVADSPGLGHGSTFTLRLPLAAVENAGADSDDTQTAPESGKLRHLLIVDDNVDAAESLGLLLGSLGHQVEVAHNGTRALELAAKNPPDVVLLDIGMPGLDGYEIARRMREANQGHPMQIIAVTGWGQPSDREKSRAAGFDEHLVKPVDQQQLADILGDRAQSTLH
jgi:CheY-like chemotaxis protein